MLIGKVLAVDESCSSHEALEVRLLTCIACSATIKLQNIFIEAELEPPQENHSKHVYAEYRR